MPNRTLLAASCALLLPLAVAAQTAPGAGIGRAETQAVEGGAPPIPAASTLPVRQCLENWIQGQSLVLGPNPRPGSGTMFVATEVAEVRAPRGSAQWVAAREAGFTRAELQTRSALASFVATEIRSNRSVDIFAAGADEPPPPTRPATERISNAERLSTLTGLALDDAIRQFNPNWNGANMTEEQRRAQAVQQQVRVRESIAARARLFTSGAFTAYQCEGPNDENTYSVGVVMFWSSRLQAISQMLVDPSVRLPPAPPGLPLNEQFAARARENADWLAFTGGTRVWTDERGQRVVVGFGAVAATGLASVDEQRARLRALAAIQRFAGERIESRSTEDSDFADRTTGEGTRTFDASAFEQRIESRANQISLSGVHTVTTWRGRHPAGDVNMQVVVLRWSPDSAAAGQALGREIREGQQGQAPAARAPDRVPPTGAPTRQGAGSNAADF